MNQARFQSRVGFFVVVCLVLTGALLLAFSKGASLFTPTYAVKMRISNVSGLKERSAVFLSGVQVGTVVGIELAPGNTNVFLHLKIFKKYSIHRDADFVIEQIGVLGDQFVAIYPKENKAPLLQDGDEVPGQEPFNLQEAARSAGDVLTRVGRLTADISGLVNDLREAVTNAKQAIFQPAVLSNVTVSLANFREVSEHTLTAARRIESLVSTNSAPLAEAVSNLVRFAADLNKVGRDLDDTILTNRADLRAAVQNFEDASASLKQITADIDAGKGLAGALLKDPRLPAQFAQIAGNLATLSSNLNRYGLLYKPRPPKPAGTTPHIYPGKSPF
ncbi:MAG: MCE family protein [Verrucomicrobia bacterium]|nr:MCE family protein [Verrucomicrobiota bacterium]